VNSLEEYVKSPQWNQRQAVISIAQSWTELLREGIVGDISTT
jgi:hypothetical protein